jgi:transposase
LEPEAQAGRIIGAKTVQAKLAEHLQKPVSLSGVYGLLRRHDWTPKRPRPKHPQGDEEAKGLFKKTSGQSQKYYKNNQ